MDSSFDKVTLPELGSSELLLQLYRSPEVPRFGQYALFFQSVLPK